MLQFYNKTRATFIGCSKPKRKPDYVSFNCKGEISSVYWYTTEGVYRLSDHWSLIYTRLGKSPLAKECRNVASCWWILRTTKAERRFNCGFCPWNKFHKIK